MTGPAQVRREVSHYSLMIHDAGWVANHDGNVSAKEGPRLFITPTGVSKRLCTPDSIAETDLDGKPAGRGKPPSEVALHAGAYRARPDAFAVIHAHPPYASAFALVGRALDPIGMPEVAVSLGDPIPLVALFVPKDPAAAAAVGQALLGADAALLAGNGAITIGPDLETAYLRMELLEHYARILTLARAVGEPLALSEAARAKCLELRKAAGLHHERDGGERSAQRAERAKAGGPALPDRGPLGTDDMRRVVLEEVRRALGDKK